AGVLQRTALSRDAAARAKVVNGVGIVEVVRWEPREIVLRTQSDAPAEVLVGQFYFPNWVAEIDGQPDSAVHHSPPDGLLSVTAPPGQHQITLQFGRGPEERTGQIISAISALCLVIYAAFAFAARFRNKPKLG